MLQFNATITTITTRFTSRLLWRLNALSTTSTATVVSEPIITNVKETTSNITMDSEQRIAFNKLKIQLCSGLNAESSIMSKIGSAQNVNDLLEIMKTPSLSQIDIEKAMKTIASWANKNSSHSPSTKDKINAIENSEGNIEIRPEVKHDNEDDVSRYSDLSTSEMIKEISKLSQSGHRNIQLLKYFFQNIVEYNAELHPGECSNLLYSMSNLGYSDERLLKKICSDLIAHSALKAMPVTTLLSMIKSMAMVRYKNDMFLLHVCHDVININAKYKPKQIANILLSFATLGYHSEQVDKIIQLRVPQLTLRTLGPTEWLNLVWSLIVFRRAERLHIASVLDESFIKKLMFFDPKRKLSYQLKILNINGYAKNALKTYTGPYIRAETVPYIVSKRSKQKEVYIKVLEDTLKNLLPSPSHFKMNINTHMGFLLDAVLYMDTNFKPVDVNSVTSGQFTKIAIMLVDYYDTCLGDLDYQGLIKLYIYLLTCQQYEVICIPYQHFGIEDKIEKRVSYMKRQLWKRFKKPF